MIVSSISLNPRIVFLCLYTHIDKFVNVCVFSLISLEKKISCLTTSVDYASQTWRWHWHRLRLRLPYGGAWTRMNARLVCMFGLRSCLATLAMYWNMCNRLCTCVQHVTASWDSSYQAVACCADLVDVLATIKGFQESKTTRPFIIDVIFHVR